MRNHIALSAAALAAFAEGNPIQQVDQPFAPAKRDSSPKTWATVGEYYCGHWPSASKKYTEEMLGELDNKLDQAVIVDPMGCSRIGCIDMSGLYVCNDNDETLEITLEDALDAVSYLYGQCGNTPSFGENVNNLSGQGFTNQGWNVGIAYSNCEHSVTERPADYAPGPGPYGEAFVKCNFDDYPACQGAEDSDQCRPDSIDVDSEDSVDCPDRMYLSANYGGPGDQVQYGSNMAVIEGWSVGFDLGIDSGQKMHDASLSADFSVSYTRLTSTGTTSGSSSPCGPAPVAGEEPGNFTCGLQIKPRCFHIVGTCEGKMGGHLPFELYAPQVANDSLAIITPDICTCTNCPDVDHPDAPNACVLECQTDCVTY